METSSRNAVFVSDLHLFSPRSAADHTPHWICECYPGCHTLVLGGDIFDFRWSQLSSPAATLSAAKAWLLTLISVWDGRIICLPGNHDCLPEYLAELERLQSKHLKFTWHPHAVQLGHVLCLHGDIVDAGSVQQLMTYRQRFHHSERQTFLRHRAYDVAVAARMHQMVPWLRETFQAVAPRLIRAVQTCPEFTDDVKTVIFGHTHRPLCGVSVGGLKLYNPGAALRHLTYCPVEFHADARE